MAVLEVAGLEKGYRSPDGFVSPIVAVESFALAAGEQVALHGASGSGKTTFLHLLAGVLVADGGRITLAGHELTALGESERDRVRGRHVGYVFQTFNLLQGFSALENVELAMRFGNGVDRAFAEALLERVGLAERRHHLPRQLSIGQQQRVAVARALANRPAVVLADEPTGSLDRRRAREAIELIQETCSEQGAALLVVSHDGELLARFADARSFEALNRATPLVPDARGER